MYASNLKLINLRNHTNSFYELSNETLFTGENGSGKTTILEALYILFGLRSFKKQPLSSAVTFNKEFFRIESEIKNGSFISDAVCLFKNKRITTINGEDIENIADYIYNHPVACYTPEVLGILSKEQQDRRNFIDRFIFYYDKEHIYDIKYYNRLLSQKQAEFDKKTSDFIYLDILNEKIICLSNKISSKRVKIIDEVNKNLKELYNSLDFNMENVFINYSSNISDTSLLNKEKFMKKSLYGIHRDKIEMCLDERIIEKFSSTGQKKTFILLCLYSFIKIIEESRKTSIITLLDDFEAALDKKRAEFIKNIFSNSRQVLYTGVDNTRLNFENVINIK